MSELTVIQVFNSLEGEWALSRKIPDVGSMVGMACFQRVQPQMLHYREEGMLDLDAGRKGPAYREYFYLLEEDTIRIAFASGNRPEGTLHRLRPSTGLENPWPATCEDTHGCGNDVYYGTYHFQAPERLQVTLAVKGPAKDYTIRTELTKTSAR